MPWKAKLVSKRGKHAGNFVLGKRWMDLPEFHRPVDTLLTVGGSSCWLSI